MKYGIEKGQVYVSASNGKSEVTVLDVETYADCDDVVILDEEGQERRIDAFKLAMVRYCLKEG